MPTTKKQTPIATKKVPAKKVPVKKASIVKKPVATKKLAVTNETAAPVTTTKKKAPALKKSAPVKTTGCVCVRTCKPEESFWICDGPVVQSLAHLKSALKGMSEAQFAYHTRRDGNDFARWIRECLKDDACAKRVEKAKTRTTTIQALKSSCCK
jgi:hypothetical protein